MSDLDKAVKFYFLKNYNAKNRLNNIAFKYINLKRNNRLSATFIFNNREVIKKIIEYYNLHHKKDQIDF